MSSQTKIYLRTSDDLYQWSAPTEIVSLDVSSDQRLYDASLASQGDPGDLGDRFYVFYLQRTKTSQRLLEPRLQRVEVKAGAVNDSS